MAVALVQSTGVTTNNATSTSRAYTSNVTSGNLLVVVSWKISSSTDGYAAGDCTKSAGTATVGTWTLDSSYQYLSTYYINIGIWSAPVTGSGSCTITVANANAGSYHGLGIAEFSGTDTTSSRVNAYDDANTAASGAPTTGTISSGGAGVFIGGLTCLSSGGTDTMTPDAAFTTIYEEENGAASAVGSSIYRIVTETTSDAASWTSPTTIPYNCIVVAYKASGTPGSVSQPSPVSATAAAKVPTLSVTGNVSAAKATATAAIPTPTASVAVGVSAVIATATAQVPAPTASGVVTASIDGKVATATAAIPTHAVSGVQTASVDGTIATATAAIPTPTISIAAGVSATTAAATAAIPTPTLSVSANVNAEPAAATAAIPTPALSVKGIVSAVLAEAAAVVLSVGLTASTSLTAVPATASAAVLEPGVSATGNVAAVIASATAEIPAPTVTVGTGLSAVVAEATAQVPTPEVAGVVVGTVAGEVATATAAIITPTVEAVQTASVDASTAVAVASPSFEILSNYETDANQLSLSTNKGYAQSFDFFLAKTFISSAFKLERTDTPTGYVYSKLYSAEFVGGAFRPLALLATSNPIDASNLVESGYGEEFGEWVGFVFPPTPLSASTVYCITVEWNGSGGQVLVATDSTDPMHTGNGAILVSGAWTGYTTFDVCHRVFVLGTPASVAVFTGANVDGVVASATADVLVPELSITGAVSGAVAEASAAIPTHDVLTGTGVKAEVATATAQIPESTLSVAPFVDASIASAAASIPEHEAAVSQEVGVSGEPATATAAVLTPSVEAVITAAVDATIAQATAAIPAPSLVAGSTVDAVSAEASAAVPSPAFSVAANIGPRHDVIWTGATYDPLGLKLDIDGNVMTSLDGSEAGAISLQSLSTGDGKVDWVELVTGSWVGLTSSVNDPPPAYGGNWQSIDFAISTDADLPGILRVYENGTQKLFLDAGYQAGDVLSIAIVGGVVKYYHGDTEIYSSLNTPTYPIVAFGYLRSYQYGSIATWVTGFSGEGVIAAAAGDIPVPYIAGAAGVQAEVAEASAEVLTPEVTVGVAVEATIAQATALVNTPALTYGNTVVAVPAEATALVKRPTVTGSVVATRIYDAVINYPYGYPGRPGRTRYTKLKIG